MVSTKTLNTCSMMMNLDLMEGESSFVTLSATFTAEFTSQEMRSFNMGILSLSST